MKRVRIQSAHGILIPGGANSPRRAMWRSRHQTLAYLAAALVLYGLLCNTRNLLRDAAIIPDVPREPTLVYEESSGTVLAVATHEDCPEYGHYASRRHEPTTRGRYDLPYQRPARACRKVVVPEVEEVIQEMNRTIKDPDLFRLFENCFPNTLDTSVTWTGVSSTNANEEVSPPRSWPRDRPTDRSIDPSSSSLLMLTRRDSSPSSPLATSTPCGCATRRTSSRAT